MIFFGGLSIHLSKAILAHLFSYNITWGATKKEVERSNFFLEVPKILVRFRVALILCVLVVGGMVALTLPFIPRDWIIPYSNWSGELLFIVSSEFGLTESIVVIPLAISITSHLAYPILLNPYLMVFSY